MPNASVMESLALLKAWKTSSPLKIWAQKKLEKITELQGKVDAGTATENDFSMLDKIPYGYRILAPIYWNEKIVSFQARDYSGKQDRRYLACPMVREVLHHKHILYMNPKGSERIGFCVEGIVDVWRFTRYAFATFGIEYTKEQIRNISKLYGQVFIIFDPETQAQLKALKLKAELEFRKIKVTNIILDSDPGDLKQEEADYLIKDLTRKFI